jgi:hypothetical protein
MVVWNTNLEECSILMNGIQLFWRLTGFWRAIGTILSFKLMDETGGFGFFGEYLGMAV